jgi:hypothetical protein
MRQRTGSITEILRPGFMEQSLRQCLYLLGKSFDRYGKLKKLGAPDILVDAEKILKLESCDPRHVRPVGSSCSLLLNWL